MYVASVIGLLCLLPVLSTVIEPAVTHVPLGIPLFGKWYVFWAVGIRLLLAGIRQISQPAYTAQTLLGIKDASSHLVVRELGIAIDLFDVDTPFGEAPLDLEGRSRVAAAGTPELVRRLAAALAGP